MSTRIEIVSAVVVAVLCCMFAHEAIAGQPLIGGEFRVNANGVGVQERPRLAIGSDGRFLVAWHEQTTGISGRLFDAAGNSLTSDFQITSDLSHSHYLDADALAGGGFVVVWGGTKGQRLDSTGNVVGTEFQIPTTSGYRLSYQAVTGRDDGGFVVAWTNHLSGLDANVYARVFDASGTPAGNDFRVNSYTTEYQGNPSVDSLADGGFVVVWAGRGQDGSFMSIFGQRYDSSGLPSGTEFAAKATTADLEFWTEVKGTPDGGFVVAWMFEDIILDIGSGISARKFDAAGLPVGLDFQVSSATIGNNLPAVGVAADSSFVIAWQGSEDQSGSAHIFGRRFQADTTPIGPSFPLSSFRTTYQTEPEVGMLPTGDLVSVWQTPQTDGDSQGLFGAFGCVDDGVDSDGDGIGDACDICTDTTPQYIDTSAKLNFRFIDAVSLFPNDRVSLRGQLALPPGFGFQDIDPLSVPIRLRLENDGGGALVDVTFPTSAFSNGGAGWVRNGTGTTWSFRDKSDDPVNGIVALKLTSKNGGVQVTAKGRNGLYGIHASEEAAQAIVTFGDALNGECATTNFVAADCTFDGLGVGFRCKK